jgi:hypothetical protein
MASGRVMQMIPFQRADLYSLLIDPLHRSLIQRFSLFGGVPRYVFDPFHTEQIWDGDVSAASTLPPDVLAELETGPMKEGTIVTSDECLHYQTKGQAMANTESPLLPSQVEYHGF